MNSSRLVTQNFVQNTESAKKIFQDTGMSRLVALINQKFFAGEVFNPKPFTSLCSVYLPHVVIQYSQILSDDRGQQVISEVNNDIIPQVVRADTLVVTIVEGISWSGVLGYVEGIPVIGSAIAAINSIGHLFCMWIDYLAISSLTGMDAKSIVNLDDRYQHYVQLANTFISYTVHRNAAITSALAIIPLAKPVMRLVQGLLYNDSNRSIVSQNIPADNKDA